MAGRRGRGNRPSPTATPRAGGSRCRRRGRCRCGDVGPPRSPADPAGTRIRRWVTVPGSERRTRGQPCRIRLHEWTIRSPRPFSAGRQTPRAVRLLRNPDLTSGAWPETREVSNWARFRRHGVGARRCPCSPAGASPTDMSGVGCRSMDRVRTGTGALLTTIAKASP